METSGGGKEKTSGKKTGNRDAKNRVETSRNMSKIVLGIKESLIPNSLRWDENASAK